MDWKCMGGISPVNVETKYPPVKELYSIKKKAVELDLIDDRNIMGNGFFNNHESNGQPDLNKNINIQILYNGRKEEVKTILQILHKTVWNQYKPLSIWIYRLQQLPNLFREAQIFIWSLFLSSTIHVDSLWYYQRRYGNFY